MNTEIFIPMFYMVLLTFTVSLIGTIVRFKNVLVDKKHTGIEMMKFSPPSSATEIIKQADRNLTNLFEFPILFYVICICIFVTNKVDDYFITLSYWFFYLRLIHSIYHIFFNNLIIKGGYPVRSFIWVPASAIVIWMWIRFITIL